MSSSDWIAVLVPLLVLCGLGLFMMRAHQRSWNAYAGKFESELEQSHYTRRYRRRMQASGMLVLLGIVTSAGQLIDGKSHPLFFTLYWMGALCLTFWVVLLALGDIASIAGYSRVAQSKLDTQRRELELELQRMKAKQGNGHATTHHPPPPEEFPKD